LLKAFCPEKQVEENPVVEIVKYIIFRKFDSFVIKREEKYGGKVEFKSYEEFENAYRKGEIHPLDLKNSVAEYLNEILEPVRNYFEKNEKARELYETVKNAMKL